MELKSITVRNYRSIKDQTFLIKEKDGTHTYTLIGINESGKSSFLTAVSLVDSGNVVYPRDFYDDAKDVEVFLTYTLGKDDNADLASALAEKNLEKDLIAQIQVQSVDVCIKSEPSNPSNKKIFDRITFKNTVVSDYTLVENVPVKKNKDGEHPQESLNLEDLFAAQFPKYFWKVSHHITFWKSDEKHLINEQVDLNAFAENPKEVSIPLMNCFALAGIDDIAQEVQKITTNPAEVNNLQEKLSDKVTAHIKKVWSGHHVKIKFQVDNMKLSFLVEDEKVKYMSKTTSQRSDGFRQFISFLLTISAESASKRLSNALLLLDEPETHLHPQAQECLREELIKISKTDEDNIVLFATHSSYMIDRSLLDRCYRVHKQGNRETEITPIEGKISSFAEINYEVFDIPSTDYHNELYGFLEDICTAKLEGLEKSKKWENKKTNKTEDVSLPKYIRNSIHHPENTLNDKYKPEELDASIKTLRKLKETCDKEV